MVDLEFSIIDEPSPSLLRLLHTFQENTGIHLHLQVSSWENAWSELVTNALYGKGPDVSHIGSTWTGSLIAMNALRPFSGREIRAMGGADAFLPQAWQSGILSGETQVWSIPWTTYTFVLAYRRDLLQKAGIDENTAFSSTSRLAVTLAGLQAAGVDCPWIVPVDYNHVDTLHYVASWIWEAGGDFINHDGSQVTFTQPAALAGLQGYYALLRYCTKDFPRLDDIQAEELFSRGQGAVCILGVDRPFTWKRLKNIAPIVLEHLGVLPMPGIPWVGGDNLIIWKHTNLSPEKERAALSLITFLGGKSAQQTFCHGDDTILPSRREVLADLPEPESMHARAAMNSLHTGRAYPAFPMWGRIEHQLGIALGRLGEDILAGSEVLSSIHDHLDPVARRLDLLLKT